METLEEHASWLAHIHLADTGRRNPGTGRYDYDRFFGYLKEIGFTGMISVECTVERPEADMAQSLVFLRRHWPADCPSVAGSPVHAQPGVEGVG